MSASAALAGFVGKWRARWPEWNIARVFVADAQRDSVDAWFALLQELTDAAWGGSDPTPGLAKLAWWNEELRGWSKGARRHPLGEVLQRLDAPWSALAASLMALQQSRASLPDHASDAVAASTITSLRPFTTAVADCERALFGTAGDAVAVVERTLLAERLLTEPYGAEALDVAGWPQGGTRPRRLQAAFVHARLVHFAATGRHAPLSPVRALWVAWRAARKARAL